MTTRQLPYLDFVNAWQDAGSPVLLYDTVPVGVEGWRLESGAQGVESFTPPHLERVVMFMEADGQRIEHLLFDRTATARREMQEATP